MGATLAAHRSPTAAAKTETVRGVRIVSGDWRLLEDRPGKPGWVTTVAGAAIEFELTFGQSPRVVVVYEVGYEGFGDATISLVQPTAAYLRGFLPACPPTPCRGRRAFLDSTLYGTQRGRGMPNVTQTAMQLLRVDRPEATYARVTKGRWHYNPGTG